MKGQYLTLEYIIFFVIGVVMIVLVYYNFSDMNEKYELATTEYQLTMTGHLIMGNVISIYEASNYTDTKISHDLDIPTKLSNCIYSIRIINDFIRLECLDVPVEVDLTSYNFNIIIKNNILYSTDGTIHMTVEDGEVVLE